MNPSVDLFGTTERLIVDAKSRCQTLSHEPGGGGINVARNLHRLQLDVRAVFPAGGLNGDYLERLLERDKLPFQRIHSKTETRQNLALTEKASGNLFHFVFPGPELEESEWQACLSAVTNIDPAPGYIVLSGSLPSGVPDDFFARIAAAARERKIKVVLDTSGPGLKPALEEGVYLAKLNREEFADLGYSQTGEESDNTYRSRLDAMARMVADGYAEVLIVTLGAEGALLASRHGEKLHAAPPPTRVVSHVGAGDGFVSIMVYQLHQGKTLEEALRYAVAAAAAAVKTPGNQLPDMSTIEEIAQQVHTA